MGHESEHDNDDRVIVSREDLRAIARGETSVGAIYDRNPKWGRRAALTALAGTGAAAFFGGQAAAETDPSGAVGPFERAYADRVNFIDQGTDPASLSDGDCWYNSSE